MNSGSSTSQASETANQSSPAMWVPNLRPGRAAALAVPTQQPYQQAVREKLIRLLEEAGQPRAKAAVQSYLEQDENSILPEDFPDGWAEQMLTTGAVSMLVLSGDPDSVDPASSELAKEALELQQELNLETFLEVAPA